MIQINIQFDPTTQQVAVQSPAPPHVVAFIMQKAQLAVAQQPLKVEGNVAVANGHMVKRLLEGM